MERWWYSGSWLRLDGRDGRHPGPKAVGQSLFGIEHDLDRDSLRDLGEVARGVIGGEQGELRSTGGGNRLDVTVEDYTGKAIHRHLRPVACTDVPQLRLLIVRDDPDSLTHQGDDLRTWTHQLACPNLSFSHHAIGRRHDPRVVEVDPSQLDCRLPCAHIRLELYLLSIQHRHLPALRLQLGLVAVQRCPKAFFIRHRLLELLVRARPRFLQLLFADSFEPGALDVGSRRLDVGLSLRDLAEL